ncbi:D-alanine--D-alanine ligase [Corallococcus sp. H22C18031201]|uniref:D-alanine--D-alanine ligase family protein n=1 Tax=Citreicoccus inhibens TaxID=2849499 RepID=UPI000E75D4EC|nr:D-alanine--D-alanine ligase [Citreicoccus inhibens]MBU8900660.1 D-alanine--D-alanine ligase [Citreicoccus inhibens]RJS25814.1 D-alanine--D-alanine ligase [Corallococcus sp. H22C18031201]
MGKRVGVLMGGWGEEREISLKTGEAVVAALESLGHHVTRVFAGPGLDRALRAAELDVAFVALHGRMGEDGRVQGLLELLELPYTGSGVLASALAMNKPMAKKLFRLHNLPTPRGYRVARADLARLTELHADWGFPCIVKPSCGGSSVGCAVVRDAEALLLAVARACRYGGEALVEQFVEGREVTVAILGDAVLGSCEMDFHGDAFDFDAKYKGGTRCFHPPRLSPTRIANVEAQALAAYRALGCRGYARVDLLCSDTQNDVVLEVNSLPGLTPTSLLPRIAEHAGLSFAQLVAQVLAAATRDEAQVSEPPTVAAPLVPLRAAM